MLLLPLTGMDTPVRVQCFDMLQNDGQALNIADTAAKLKLALARQHMSFVGYTIALCCAADNALSNAGHAEKTTG